MFPKRLLFLPALMLLIFLGVYSWNQRTRVLDNVASNTGLEAAGYVLKCWDFMTSSVQDILQKHRNLAQTAEENRRLRKELDDIRLRLSLAVEDRAELKRLRHLLSLSPPEGWQVLGARVLAERFGPNAPLFSLLLNRGYMTGALPNTPVMTPEGVIGRVHRAGPTTSGVLLLINPNSRIAVIGQETRVQAVLSGSGLNRPLELQFVAQDTAFHPGELLITSGLDMAYPKGLPIARIISSDSTGKNIYQALPLADLFHLEEVLLVSRKAENPPPDYQQFFRVVSNSEPAESNMVTSEKKDRKAPRSGSVKSRTTEQRSPN
ncbi:MAG: rod shape-determining protein MreC [Desulfovibrionaceae bacterium]|nr:rod shape-determining protein MreC [Desulfovibrionaceae bacterium]